MNKKIKIIVFAAAVAFLFTTIAPYAQAAQIKIGYVDLFHVFGNYEKTKEQDGVLDKEKKEKREKREGMVNKIRKIKDEMDLLSADAKDKKQTQLDEEIGRLQEYEQQAAMSVRKEESKIMRDILKEIDDAVQKYAKDNNYTVVLNKDKRMVLYGKEQDDLTQKILDMLNSSYKK